MDTNMVVVLDEKIKEEVETEHKEAEEEKPNTLVEDTNLAAKRLEEATKAAQEERLAREESYARMKLGGSTEAGSQPVVKKPMTDIEYAEALERGEVNPMQDGVK